MRTEEELLQALRQNFDGTAVIASTVRAARALRQRFNQTQQAMGSQGWRSPQILAWEPWLRTLWNAAILCGAESRVLLTGVQETELWRQVLARDEAAAQILSIAGLADQAQQAWQSMHRYRIPLQEVRNDGSMDAQAFSRWATEMEILCRRSSYASPAQLEAALVRTVRLGKLPLPETIFLVGFDRTTPSQILLIDALRTRGCNVELVELSQMEDATAPAIVYARTLEEEIEATAYWIRRTLIENPSRRIGVVVPALGEMRDRIDATFRRILAPSSMDVHVPNARLPYEFSLGTPMQRMSRIRAALTLLQWLVRAIPTEEISWLLVHGAFGSASDSGAVDARAMLDRRFRDRNYQLGGAVSFLAFRKWLSQVGNKEDDAPLRRTIERLSTEMKRHDLKKSRSYADWRELIEELLVMAEWGLLKANSSAEYQLLRRWNQLLNEFSSLNTIASPASSSDALEKLKELAAHMLFTLETRNAPVQILGVSESAGLLFDSIWWMNAQASNWPPRGHAQPFLPWNVQRAAHMPYADPAEDNAFALRVTRRILASATKVIFSFALQESDPTTASAHVPAPELALSPTVRNVLPDVPLVAIEDFVPDLHRPQNDAEIHAESSAMETIDTEAAVPRHAARVGGGVTFLKHQAACPFRAFAELRRAAEPLAQPEQGLSPSAQGNIVHEVLQKFWGEMHSQETLLRCTDEQCRQILRGHIQSALHGLFEHAEDSWQTSLLEIEADRLEARLWEWLEVERQRPPFTVLKTEDTLDHVQLGDVEFRCRIDRIDAVEQGVVLMDYKTGPVNAKACDGDRPDEPQLPAYAVLRQPSTPEDPPLAGIAFASLHPKNTALEVVGSLPGIFASTAEMPKNTLVRLSQAEMDQKQDQWKATLTRLAEEFRAGVAVVDPKQGGQTCRYCAQALLCRIGETADAFDDAVEDEANASQGDGSEEFDQ